MMVEQVLKSLQKRYEGKNLHLFNNTRHHMEISVAVRRVVAVGEQGMEFMLFVMREYTYSVHGSEDADYDEDTVDLIMADTATEHVNRYFGGDLTCAFSTERMFYRWLDARNKRIRIVF